MKWNRDKNKTNWRELMSKIDLSPIITKIVAEQIKNKKNKIGMHYQTMHKDFDTICAFNRIQYSIHKK